MFGIGLWNGVRGIELSNGGIFLLIGTLALVIGLRKFVWWYRVKTVEPVGVGDVSSRGGLVSVSGTVSPVGETFSSPIQDDECVGYSYQVSREYENKLGDSGERVDIGSDVCEFTIDDGTGVAVVDPGVDNLEIEMWLCDGVSEFDDIDIDVDIPLSGAYVTSYVREGTLGVGDEVTVVGEVTSVIDGDADDDVYVRLGGGRGTLFVTNANFKSALSRWFRKGLVFVGLGGLFVAIGIGMLF